MSRIRSIGLVIVSALAIFSIAPVISGSYADASKLDNINEIHVCASGCAYDDIQAAIESAQPGDVVKVAAGTYTSIHSYNAPPGYLGAPVVNQLVFVDKSITILGGFSPSDWVLPDPVANPTILDAGGIGRVLFVSPGLQVNVEGFQMMYGNATGLGGFDIDMDAGGGAYVISSTLQLNQNLVTFNTARFGSGIFLVGTSGNVDQNTITNNASANGFGGGVYLKNSQVSFSFDSIQSNSAGTGSGGGIYSYNSTLTLSQSEVINNNAAGGAGLYFTDSISDLYKNSITNNHGNLGGGVYQYGGEMLMQDNLVDHNEAAAAQGGGINTDQGVIILLGNFIGGNTANSVGGGISLNHCQATVSNNTITGNTSTAAGGGASLIECENSFTDNQVISNSALAGAGGLWVYFCGGSDIYRGNTFQDNAALGGDGGGVNIQGCDYGTFEGNRLLENTASANGGGIELNSGYEFIFTKNIITGNNAAFNGGGIHARIGGDWTNNVIQANSAGNLGSGIFLVGATVNLLQNTVHDNTGGDGSGIVVSNYYEHPSTVFLTNNIIVSQTVGLTVTFNSQANLDSVLWFNNGDNTGGAGTITVTHEFSGDPLFTADGYHIDENSPAVDVGVTCNVVDDIDYQPRPYLQYDLGADEYWPAGILKFILLPLVRR